MNKVILIGRLTKDVELRYTQTNNTAVASFSLAVNRKFVKPGEERQADFFNIIAWNKLAENISKYLFKGNQVAISGRLETRSWDDPNGQKHYVTEVIAEEIDFIGSKNKQNNEAILNSPTPINKNDDTSDFICNGDDLPF
ncbi:MAG: single-stranded DNA-binding protein [Clostridia bacterium]|jgi:single-strand DNA-binding protein